MDHKLKMKWKVGVYKGSGGVVVFHAGFVSAILQIAEASSMGYRFVFCFFFVSRVSGGKRKPPFFCSKLA